jgi:hypothetical protein
MLVLGDGEDLVLGQPLNATQSSRLIMSPRHYCRSARPTSTLVWPAHQLERGLDSPPGPGIFAVTLLFERTGLLSGLGNRLGAMRIEQLAGIIVNVRFLHLQSSDGWNQERQGEPTIIRRSPLGLIQAERGPLQDGSAASRMRGT